MHCLFTLYIVREKKVKSIFIDKFNDLNLSKEVVEKKYNQLKKQLDFI